MKQNKVGDFFDHDAPDFVNKRWSYAPEGYADYNDTMQFIVNALHLRNIRNGFSCLELGSGTGFWSTKLKKLGCGEYHAIDISKKMLSLNPAEKHFCYDLNKGLPEGINDYYDVILSVHSLEYIEDSFCLVQEAIKHLKKDGVILIVTKNRRAYIWRLYKFLADLISGERLKQIWIDSNYFNELDMHIDCFGINCRIPTMMNNVNAAFPFRSKAGFIRKFISKYVNPHLSHSPNSPFSWHIGFIISAK